jgi:hypothetical protein
MGFDARHVQKSKSVVMMMNDDVMVDMTVVGWYEQILRTLGMPARFRWDPDYHGWVAEAPFTPATSEEVDALYGSLLQPQPSVYGDGDV